MKRDKFFDIAEKMYVEQFITEAEIANRIGVSDRTIRRWKALGDWGIKRDGFLKANTISKDTMYSLAHKMLDDFHSDMDNNRFIDPSRMYMFTNLMDEVLKKLKQSYTKEEFLRIIKQVVDMDEEIFPLLTEEETEYVCQTPWTEEIGNKMDELVRTRLRNNPGVPMFGTVLLDCDLIVYLHITDDLLLERTKSRNVDFNNAKNMQLKIEEEIKKSNIPSVYIEVNDEKKKVL